MTPALEQLRATYLKAKDKSDRLRDEYDLTNRKYVVALSEARKAYKEMDEAIKGWVELGMPDAE